MSLFNTYQFFKQLASLPFVDEIWLYGSRARGDNAERANINLAIICPRAFVYDWKTITQVIELADTLLEVDCVRFDTLREGTLKNTILYEKKVLYQKDAKAL